MDEIERIRSCAQHSIGRGFLFALLAIGAVVMGLVGWPVMAFRTGAVLATLAGAILLLRGHGAPHRSYRRTETWVLLGKRSALPEPTIQDVLGSILAETYRRFALYGAGVATALWIAAFAAALVGAHGA